MVVCALPSLLCLSPQYEAVRRTEGIYFKADESKPRGKDGLPPKYEPSPQDIARVGVSITEKTSDLATPCAAATGQMIARRYSAFTISYRVNCKVRVCDYEISAVPNADYPIKCTGVKFTIEGISVAARFHAERRIFIHFVTQYVPLISFDPSASKGRAL